MSSPNRLTLASFTILALSLAACRGIPKARAGTARVELEVDVAVEEGARANVRESAKALDDLVQSVVLGHADVGLRFYPVPARDYSSGQARPPHLMTVRLRSLAARARTVVADKTTGHTKTVPDHLAATVHVSIEQRRPNAPALLVGTADSEYGAGVRATSDPEPGQPTLTMNADGAAVVVLESELRTVIDRAARKALQELVPAIDREAALRAQR